MRSRHCHFYLLSPASGLAEGVKGAIQGQQEQSRRGLAVTRTLSSGSQPHLCSWGPLSTCFRLHAQRAVPVLVDLLLSSPQDYPHFTEKGTELGEAKISYPGSDSGMEV